MANIIQIKRSATTATPPSLAVGELAYSELSDNLFIGKTGNQVTKIGGAGDATKLAGIEAGAQVNTVTSVAGKTGAVTVTASDVGLGNVTNESKATMFTSPTFTGTVSGVTAAMVGLGNVDNTSDVNKPVSSATQTALNLKADLASPTFTGTVTVPTPTAGTSAANKSYVDSMSLGLAIKDPVVVGTTANIALTGLQTIDGVTVTAGQRVLVKNQTNATENGIYDAASGAWSRSADADNTPGGDNSEVRNGMFVLINSGTTQTLTQWALSTTGSITLGSTDLVFTQFGSVASYDAGTGLTLTGTTFAIDSTVLTTASTLDVTKFSSGTAAAFNGSAITNLAAGNIATGTLNDARLSTNVLLITSTIDAGTF